MPDSERARLLLCTAALRAILRAGLRAFPKWAFGPERVYAELRLVVKAPATAKLPTAKTNSHLAIITTAVSKLGLRCGTGGLWFADRENALAIVASLTKEQQRELALLIGRSDIHGAMGTRTMARLRNVIRELRHEPLTTLQGE